ncbi:hypothetical protein ACFB49_22990 [Sphingomonas sp. DBB INV C78]|uniref:hypothetical protein n=1 Tax=Sphingomonas sp. DBB INV C78 TaxID=3349434 RepID=UPI0036D3D2D5
MTRRKGERPVLRYLDRWSADHPVARSIAAGTNWFNAWIAQKATPFPRLAQRTGIPTARLMAIDQGDVIARSELEALSRAWSVSVNDLIASMPTADMVVE